MSPTCNRQPRCFPKTSIGRSWHPERQGERALCAPTQILQYDPQAPPHRIGVSRAEIGAEQGTADNQCGQVLYFGHNIKGLIHPLDSCPALQHGRLDHGRRKILNLPAVKRGLSQPPSSPPDCTLADEGAITNDLFSSSLKAYCLL